MKKYINKILSGIFFALFAGYAPAQDSTLVVGGRLQYDHISYFTNRQDAINGRNEGILRLDLSSGTGRSISGKAIFELREDLSDPVRNRIWIDELWIRHRMRFADITLGKQIIAWGTCDGVNPVNSINPVDYSDLLDTDDEIIGVYGVRTRFFFGSSDLDFFLAPIAGFGKLPAPNSRWFPTTRMMGIPEERIAAGLDVSVTDQAPPAELRNGEFALRMRNRFRGFDLAVSYFNGFDHLPDFEMDSLALFQETPALSFYSNYFRQQVAGLELAFALPYGVGLRGEAACFFPEKDRPGGNQFIQAVAGVDRSFEIGTSTLWLLIQYLYDHRLTGPDYRLFDTRHIFRNALMGKVDLTLASGLAFSIVSIYNLDGNDYLVRPEFSYLTPRGIKFSVRLDILEGPEESFFGSYPANDRIQVRVNYSF